MSLDNDDKVVAAAAVSSVSIAFLFLFAFVVVLGPDDTKSDSISLMASSSMSGSNTAVSASAVLVDTARFVDFFCDDERFGLDTTVVLGAAIVPDDLSPSSLIIEEVGDDLLPCNRLVRHRIGSDRTLPWRLILGLLFMWIGICGKIKS